MRLALIGLLCVLNVGCAIVRKDREEPVENGPREEKAEPVLKPSEVLKPKSHDIASPMTDHFWMRGTYFQGDVTTLMRVDSSGSATPDGTLLNGEDDLGLDDVVNQGRMEFNLRMGERNNVRIDYFKLNRFGEVILTDPVSFSDFDFVAGDRFRTELDWSTLSLSYTYSIIKNDRIECQMRDLFSGIAEGTRALLEGYSDGELALILDFVRRSNAISHAETLKLRASERTASPAPGKARHPASKRRA